MGKVTVGVLHGVPVWGVGNQAELLNGGRRFGG